MVWTQWTVVLHTASTDTALKLLDRVLRRLKVPAEAVRLRPWGAEHTCRAAFFLIAVPDEEPLPTCLRLSTLLAHTWTVDMEESAEILLRAWTPAEYRRMTLEGIDAISWVVSRQPLPTPCPSPRTRQRRLPSGVVVDVVDE